MNTEVLKQNIRFLKGVGEKRAELFYKLGVVSVGDLLNFYPRRYIDYSDYTDIFSSGFDEVCVIKAMVLKKAPAVRLSNNRTLFKVVCGDETGDLQLTFFNSEYTVNRLEIGKEYLFYGKVSGNFKTKQMLSPSFINANSVITQEPIYPLTKGLSNKIIQNAIKSALSLVCDLPDFIDESILKKYNFPSFYTAVKNIHFASSNKDLEMAKNRLIFNELLILQLGLQLLSSMQKNEKTNAITYSDINPFYSSLPFSPTNAQKNAVSDIINDFKEKIAMNRMLQGDVGSGKTLVGVASMFIMAKNDVQSCMMAPTEILAVQHYHSVLNMLKNMDITVALLTSSTKAKEKREILENLKNGKIHILIGTHAVLNEKVEFLNLGLCITDEQHRFGVKQRNIISQKGDNPHILVMSATPIPRTLAMVLYGNMKVSVINEMPKGRKAIQTHLVSSDTRARMFGFIQKHIDLGQQAYIVLPAIEESENMGSEIQNVTDYYNDVIKQFLPNVKAEILHGKMKSKEKDAVMQKFKNGEIDLLCSTTVVEVGVDVPNAVLMIIENAERYGLSALHQLRGRVGRGDKQSYCILVSDSKSQNSRQRLKVMEKTQDGFMISQFDLENRGPGDFFGDRQHGLPTLKLAQLSKDLTILKYTEIESQLIISKSPDLKEFPLIKKEIQKLFSGITL